MNMICRLCLIEIKLKNQVSIFTTTDEDEESQVAELIAKYLNLEVTQHDTISKTLCQDCWNQIEQFDNFWIYVDEKQNTLQNVEAVTKWDASSGYSAQSESEEFLGWDEGMSKTSLPDDENNDIQEWDEWNMDDEQEDLVDDQLELEESEIMKWDQTLPSLEEEILELANDGDNLLNFSKKRRRSSDQKNPEKSTQKTNSSKNQKRSSVFMNEDTDSDVLIEDDINDDDLEDEIDIQNESQSTKENKDYLRQTLLPSTARTNRQEEFIDKSFPTKLDEIDIFIVEHMDLQCDLCDERFEKYNDSRLHYGTQHNCREYFKCCDRRFRKRMDLYEHIKWHLNPDPFKCDICGKHLKSRIGLVVHKMTHMKKKALEYKCKYCKKIFPRDHMLKKHMEIFHASNRNHVCKLCNKRYSQKYILDQHVKSVHENNVLHVCNICGEKFMIKQLFEEHMLKHQGNTAPTDSGPIQSESQVSKSNKKESSLDLKQIEETPHNSNIIKLDEIDIFISQYMVLKCDLCEVQFEKYNDSRPHYRKLHKCREYIKCCDSRHNKRMDLYEHIKWHLDPDYFKCETCGKHLKNRSCMNVHKMSHMNREELKFNCEYCDKRFAWQYMLTSHIKIFHEDNRNFCCPHCDKRFTVKSTLKKHIKAIHENVFPHICETCGKKFKFKPSFDAHVLEHQGVKGTPAKCPECGEWFKSKSCLHNHMNKHNTVDVDCKHCGQVCVSRTALRAHIQYYHRQYEGYECSFCGKLCKTPKSLKEHEAAHKNENLYKCRYCDMEFRYSASMYYHIKRQHTEEWLIAQAARTKTPPNVETNSQDEEEVEVY